MLSMPASIAPERPATAVCASDQSAPHRYTLHPEGFVDLPRQIALVVTLTPAHDAVLALLAWFPDDANGDVTLTAQLLYVPEAEASRLLDELEDAGCLTSAMGSLQ